MRPAAGFGEAVAQAHRDEALALDDFGRQFLGLGADLRPFDVVLGQIAVQLGVARIAVVGPAGRHEEVHDVQAEADVAGAGLLVEKRPRGDAADVALLADASLQGVGVDLDIVVRLRDADVVSRLGGMSRSCRQHQNS